MEKEIDINGKKVVIKEINYLDSIEISELREKEGLRAAISKQIQLSTGLTNEEIEKFTLKEGVILQKVVNEINDSNITDFQKPTEEKEN